MQIKSSKQLYYVILEFAGGVTRTVKVKAVSREKAEERARRFHPSAHGVRRESA